MTRNFAAERKRVREEYEALIDECRAAMDKTWEAKKAKYTSKAEDPFEDIRVSGLRFDALFEDVTERNQRIEKLRHEMSCKLNKISEMGARMLLTPDIAERRAKGDAFIVDVGERLKRKPSRGQPASPLSPTNVAERRGFFTTVEAEHPQPLTPPISPTATMMPAVPASAPTSTLSELRNGETPPREPSSRPVLKIKFLSVLELLTKQQTVSKALAAESS